MTKDNTGNYVGASHCEECGLPFMYVGDVVGSLDGVICKCKEEKKAEHPQFYGWICPLCGRGNSPHSDTCPCLPTIGPQVTY